jgi:excinuclease ABC subunit A
VDYIGGLSPAIAIEQKSISKNPRSTVGTVTEVVDYLRVLFSRAGVQHCPQCGRAVEPLGAQQMADRVAVLPVGTRFQVLAPLARERKLSDPQGMLQAARRDGFTRLRLDGEMVDLEAKLPAVKKSVKHTLELVVDRLVRPDPAASDLAGEFKLRLIDSIETALRAGKGHLSILLESGEEFRLTEHNACPTCEVTLPRLTASLFSSNSPAGMCPECTGLGTKLEVDPDLIVEHPELSLLDGASRWYGNMRKKKSKWWLGNLETMASHYGVDLELPWKDLPPRFRDVVLYGSGDEKLHFTYESDSGDSSWRGESVRTVKGIVFHVNRLFRQTKSEGTRRYYMSFMSHRPCPACQGTRLNAEARYVTVGGTTFPQVLHMTIEQAHAWVSGLLGRRLSAEQLEVVGEVLKEVYSRLQFMLNVGLHYLALDRPAPTLSGGEGQRIRLASQLGCGLVGVLYILDEPSIGLHARDQANLIGTLETLRDMGNSVLVVEHDAATMRAADWLVDLGPGAGVNGGRVVAQGTPEQVAADPGSITGRYLAGLEQVRAPNGGTRRKPSGWLEVCGARLFNLKNITARFPLGVLTCVTGVSGSGKSSLVAETLYPALTRALHGAQSTPGPHDRIAGLEQLDKVINITQEPIGRTPRSNPATYAEVFTEIRKVFAGTPEARARGYNADRFSFNVKGGRCEACMGHGQKRIEMHFLPDVWVTCQECKGARYNRQTLEVSYRGKTIADVLEMDIQEALAFFANHPNIRRILQTLEDVGLDYVKLGQSATTLSGGEAQRVKLAKELSRLATGRTVYILDEPTTGLHFVDIQRLLDVLHRLTDAGNTVIIIEHNLDVVRTADWIIDLGPEGGEAGGYIMAEGTPEQVAAVEASFTGRFLR